MHLKIPESINFYNVSGTLTLMVLLFGQFMRRFRLLDYDTSEAKRCHYHALKNYQSVLDQVEVTLLSRRKSTKGDSTGEVQGNAALTRDDLEKILHRIVPTVQEDEVDIIFKSFDSDKSGTVEHTDLKKSTSDKLANNFPKFKKVWKQKVA